MNCYEEWPVFPDAQYNLHYRRPDGTTANFSFAPNERGFAGYVNRLPDGLLLRGELAPVIWWDDGLHKRVTCPTADRLEHCYPLHPYAVLIRNK